MLRWLFVFTVLINFFSINSNAQWEKANGGKELPDSTSILAILTNGNTILAATPKGIYISSNNGENWSKKNSGLEDQLEINTLGLKGNIYFVGTMDGIYSSSDNGNSWIESDNGINSESVYSFLVIGNNIYAGTTGGVFVSSNNGNNWTPKNQGLPEYEPVNALTINGNTIFAGTTAGVYASSNNGDSWSSKNFHEIVSSIAVNNNNVYISGDGVNTGLHISTDNGISWDKINSGLDISHSTKYFLLSVGDSVFAAGITTGVYVTNNNGNTWMQTDDGLSAYVQGNELMLASNYKYLFVGSKGASGYCNLWRLPLIPKDTTGVNDLNADLELMQVNPNPANEILHLTVNLPYVDLISLSISDVLGNSKFIFNNEMKSGGINNISIPVSNYSAGTYYIRLTTSNCTLVRAVIIY
ncbi:MAG: T9SS type A sorting domain-containing protein [Bacteroidetes bacterium]|nr:MAG: T9SS type A sorting domain-containing protein [Bacteroidota bacterium]